MAYKSNVIILLNFGRYAKGEEGKLKKYLPSITQLPLKEPLAFSYIDGYLSNPEKTEPITILPNDLEYIQTVADVLGEFPVKIKCEGKYGECNEEAKHLVLPYSIEKNFDEKIIRGGPEWINQTDPSISSFRCYDCAEEEKSSKGDRTIELNIGLMLPDFLTKFPEKIKWNLDRTELHKKLKKIAYQLLTVGIDDLISTKNIREDESVIMTRYTTKKIVNKMLHIPEDQLPKNNKEYEIKKLRWSISPEERGQLRLF